MFLGVLVGRGVGVGMGAGVGAGVGVGVCMRAQRGLLLPCLLSPFPSRFNFILIADPLRGQKQSLMVEGYRGSAFCRLLGQRRGWQKGRLKEQQGGRVPWMPAQLFHQMQCCV